MSSSADTPTPQIALPAGLQRAPFADTTEEAFFFPSDQHLRAFDFLGHALWTTSRVAVVLAEAGCGKTLLIHRLMSHLDDRYIAAAVHEERLKPQEFLHQVLRQYGIDLGEDDRSDRRRLLERYIPHQTGLGRTCVLVVENAQSMHPLVLEELRALAALEVGGARALKLLLLGRPSLQHVLDSPRMTEVLGTRVPRYVLGAFSEDQTIAYIAHRLRAAGATDPDALLSASLARQIHVRSRGIPGQINRICERALAAMEPDGVVDERALATAFESLGLAPVRSVTEPSPATATTGSQPGPAKLLVTIQGAEEREVVLTGNRIIIGRSEQADVRVDSAFVSRFHALIVRDGQQDLILDLGSTNGLLVGSRRVMRHVLRHRDLIQIGPAKLTYINVAAADAPVEGGETVCFARPGFLAPQGEGAGGTLLAFGRSEASGG
jgi:type II secretory pathway predicted ATPase ExeA